MVDHSFQRARFRKKITRVRNDLQRLSPWQSRQRLFVKSHDLHICAAYDEEGRRPNSVEEIAGEVRTPAARNDRAHAMREIRGRNERGRCSRAGAKQPKRKPREKCLPVDPIHRVDEAGCQQWNVEHITPIGLFSRREEVE